MLTKHEKKAHREGLTGSKMARVITRKFGGPWQVYHEMKLSYKREEAYSKFLAVGEALEPIMCDEYARLTGHRVEAVSTSYADDPYYRCHIDRKIIDPARDTPGVLEAKAANAFMAEEWAGGPPDYPLIQCLWGMYCTGYDWGAIVVMLGGYQIEWWIIERDEPLLQTIVGYAAHFRSLLETSTPPPVDGSESTSTTIKAIYPTARKPDLVPLDTDLARRDAATLWWLKDLEKQALAERRRLENVFKLHIQDREGVSVPGFGDMTWRNTSPTARKATVDLTRLHDDYPAAYKNCVNYAVADPHRVFLVKPDKTMLPPRTMAMKCPICSENRTVEVVCSHTSTILEPPILTAGKSIEEPGPN